MSRRYTGIELDCEIRSKYHRFRWILRIVRHSVFSLLYFWTRRCLHPLIQIYLSQHRGGITLFFLQFNEKNANTWMPLVHHHLQAIMSVFWYVIGSPVTTWHSLILRPKLSLITRVFLVCFVAGVSHKIIKISIDKLNIGLCAFINATTMVKYNKTI